MSQISFSDAEFQCKRKKTRKEIFLGKMDKIIPWERLESLIAPYYPKAGNGRQPYPLSAMFRIYCMQNWYNLSDPAMEDALYEIGSMRQFAGLSLNAPIPDETTILNFRHLLERHQLTQRLFKEVSKLLKKTGLQVREGTVVDATIIEAPSSTKNKRQERDPEMHQTKKGNQWYFGMKVHVGTDVSGLVHSFDVTPANTHDVVVADKLLSGDEKVLMGDAGYRGVHKREAFKGRNLDYQIAERPGVVRALKKRPRKNKTQIKLERSKAQVRATVEHVFQVMKHQFGFRKTRYKGLAKNRSQVAMLLVLTNFLKLAQKLKI